MVGFALWLDIQAALTGRDSGTGLLRAHMSNDLFPVTTPLSARASFTSGAVDQEADLLLFGKDSLTMMGKLSALALSMRSEQHSPHNSQAAQHILLDRQRAVMHFQTELHEQWRQLHPASVPMTHPAASGHLPVRLRHVYDSVSRPWVSHVDLLTR